MSVDDYGRGVEDAANIYAQVLYELNDENKRLRERAQAMWNWSNKSGCDTCPDRNECRSGDACIFWDKETGRLRALGVEVDE